MLSTVIFVLGSLGVYNTRASMVDNSVGLKSNAFLLSSIVWYKDELASGILPRCSSEERSTWMGDRAFSQKFREISVMNWGDPADVTEGLCRAYPTVGEKCLSCLGDAAGCGKDNCSIACLKPTSDGCSKCIHNHCKQQLINCVGATCAEDLPVPLTPSNSPADGPPRRSMRTRIQASRSHEYAPNNLIVKIKKMEADATSTSSTITPDASSSAAASEEEPFSVAFRRKEMPFQKLFVQSLKRVEDDGLVNQELSQDQDRWSDDNSPGNDDAELTNSKSSGGTSMFGRRITPSMIVSNVKRFFDNNNNGVDSKSAPSTPESFRCGKQWRLVPPLAPEKEAVLPRALRRWLKTRLTSIDIICDEENQAAKQENDDPPETKSAHHGEEVKCTNTDCVTNQVPTRHSRSNSAGSIPNVRVDHSI